MRNGVAKWLVMLVAGAPLFASPGVASADSCDSAARAGAELWDKFGETAKKIGCGSAEGVALILSEGATAAQFGEIFSTCYSTTSEFEKYAKKAIKAWNDLFGDDNWATIGPRELSFEEAMEGTVVSTAGRMFIGAAPVPTGVDEVEIRLKKEGGSAKTSITVCGVAPNGKTKKFWAKTIENGKDNIGEVYKTTLTGVSGYVLSVHLDAKSVTNKFEYRLTAKMHDTAVAD